MDYKVIEKNRNEICKEIIIVFRNRNDVGLDYVGDSGTGDNWTDSGYILRVLSTGLADRLNIEVGRVGLN